MVPSFCHGLFACIFFKSVVRALNEHRVPSGPLANSAEGAGIAQPGYCSAFSSTAGASHLKSRALNEQNRFGLIGNVTLWSCWMKLGCRMRWKTAKPSGLGAVVIVGAIS